MGNVDGRCLIWAARGEPRGSISCIKAALRWLELSPLPRPWSSLTECSPACIPLSLPPCRNKDTAWRMFSFSLGFLARSPVCCHARSRDPCRPHISRPSPASTPSKDVKAPSRHFSSAQHSRTLEFYSRLAYDTPAHTPRQTPARRTSPSTPLPDPLDTSNLAEHYGDRGSSSHPPLLRSDPRNPKRPLLIA